MVGFHRSVLLKEVIRALDVKKGSWYLDCTLGDGGHSLEILKRGGKVVGMDVDPQAIQRTRKRFEIEEIDGNRWKLIVGNFREVKKLLQTELERLRFEGSLMDLGVSSLQLENPERGFSFAKEGPLDMRMDPTLGVRALDLINVLTRKELNELFSKLGEEKRSRALADALVSAREVDGGVNTTKDLAELVERVVGGRQGKIHPATRIFQALRITVNDELDVLKEGLDQVKDLIKKDGHILVISFHSLEDRIVKLIFREWESEELGQVLTKKPITPKDEEIRANMRSRSAKMRVFEVTAYDYH